MLRQVGLWKSLVKKIARNALGSAGRAIDEALFGVRPSAEPAPVEQPDPFAKLKAEEAASNERTRRQK
jgi:hypothetical protein